VFDTQGYPQIRTNTKSHSETSTTHRLLDSEVFHRTLLGGGPVAAARTRSCLARVDHDSSGKKLSGVLPMIEDWHAKMC